MDLKTTILMFALICSLAAVFVLWAKWEEEKVKTRAERERRWDEISLRLNVEKELEQSKAREKCTAQSVLWFTEQLKYWKEANDDKIKDILLYHKECEKLAAERDALQDFKSSKFCSRNDHVWKDGVCVKCGRMKDA